MGSLTEPWIERFPASEAAAQVGELDRPWVADEGPLDAAVWRLEGELHRPLRGRGLAFDLRATVTWDEEQVRVVLEPPSDSEVVARRSGVLVRRRLGRWTALDRIDYLRDGVLLASRYVPAPDSEEDHNA